MLVLRPRDIHGGDHLRDHEVDTVVRKVSAWAYSEERTRRS